MSKKGTLRIGEVLKYWLNHRSDKKKEDKEEVPTLINCVHKPRRGTSRYTAKNKAQLLGQLVGSLLYKPKKVVVKGTPRKQKYKVKNQK